MDDDATPVGAILAVSIVVFLLGADLGWNLHLSTNPNWPSGSAESGLLVVAIQALLLLATVVYVVLTYRLANTAVKQGETAQDNLKVARETLDFYRKQHERETRPVIFANVENISGKKGALEIKDVQVAIYNFSKQPIFFRYGNYSFEVEDNRRMYLAGDKFRQLSQFGPEILPPYEAVAVPHIGYVLLNNDRPTLNLVFVYEGVDYKFSAHVPLEGKIRDQEIQRLQGPF